MAQASLKLDQAFVSCADQEAHVIIASLHLEKTHRQTENIANQRDVKLLVTQLVQEQLIINIVNKFQLQD